MLALLEHNAREVGLAHNIGEDRVWEDRQELVGIERHRLIASNMSLLGRGGSFVVRYVEKNRADLVGRRSQKRYYGMPVPGSLLRLGRAVSGAGQVGCLLTTDKLKCFHW